MLLERAEIELVPVTVAHLKAARRAWRRFGKGNHPAALNFGSLACRSMSSAPPDSGTFLTVIPSELVVYNPMGILITYLQVDRALVTGDAR